MLVLIIMAAIGLASSAYFVTYQSGATTGGGLFSHKRAFYAAEGTLLAATKIAQGYLASTAQPTSEGMKKQLTDFLPGLLPAEYQVSDVNVTIEGETTISPITTGAFKGLIAPQTIVKISYNIQSVTDNVGRSVVHIQSTLSLAQVSMFQFLYFIDLSYVDFSPGPAMVTNGRMHANGDLCLSGATGMVVSQVTSAGRLMHGMDARCKYQLAGDKIVIAPGTDLTYSNISSYTLALTNDNACTKCGGGGLGWADYAPSRWNGNALDQAQGVSKMSLPVPTSVQAQAGADGDKLADGTWPFWSNTGNLRFITDPVWPGDTTSVSSQKYASKAQLRIIDGVWYLKNPAKETDWPGLPIWSDHPGTATDQWGNAVGQDQLRAKWGWGATTPSLYSFYEYDSTNQTLYNNNKGVISYGNLIRDASGATPTWHPGHWLISPAGDQVCPSGVLLSSSGFVDAFGNISCFGGVNPGVPTGLLNATRAGIHDGHTAYLWPYNDSTEAQQRAKTLPMNFDVQAFQEALKSTAPGELGSYFGAGNLMGEFNGILYISVTWPGWDKGFNGAPYAPDPAPIQGANADAAQVAALAPQMQRALPYQLCSMSPTAGQYFDNFSKTAVKQGRFKVPNCANYAPLGTINAFPNKVRLVNGTKLDPTILKAGLSIVTNVGLYVQGDYNTTSDASGATATPWLPSLIAADQVNIYSNNWSDSHRSWNDSALTVDPQPASSTTYNTAILSGWARRGDSMSLHVFPSMNEDWATPKAVLTFNGSVVIGYYPVYEIYGRAYGNGKVYRSYTRNINFDKHFQYTVNQPPGSPVFFISALLDWKAE